MRRFVMGDIHGAYKALMQCLAAVGFDYENDRLIVLGDVCDGFIEVRQCIDELLKIKHCDFIIGNHDVWALDWGVNGAKPEIWTSQGGLATIKSYEGGPMLPAHIQFLQNAQAWVEFENKLFVHAGFDPDLSMKKQNFETLIWDRDLIHTAWKNCLLDRQCQFGPYEEIFLGHTTTQSYNSLEPLNLCNIWALDTGAGWSGKLTIMDVDTKQYWQSDLTPELYGMPGRIKRKAV